MSALAAEVAPIVIKARDGAMPNQKSVAVINTGGTIGMKANETGSLEPCPGYLAERMRTMPEFRRAEMPATSMFELLPLLDSSDMGPADWVRIAKLIEAVYFDYDAFVIIMGTDTMAYAASALSFMLENLGKTVVFTGSMLPLSDLFSDAQRNLIVSLVMASTLEVPEVCIFVDDTLLRGNRTVKSNSTGLDAFESPNYPPLAKLETGIRFKATAVLSQPRGRFRVHTALDPNIAVWRMIPGFDDEYIQMSIAHSTKLRAIVLELYGAGNMSSRKQSLIDSLAGAIKKGIIIVAVSQCLRGTVDLTAYALGRRLESIGVISGYDMTTETVCVKLAYLLSYPGMTAERVREYMGISLRGEVTEVGTPMTEGGDVRISMESLSKAVAAMRGSDSVLPPAAPSSSTGVTTATTVSPSSGSSPVLSVPTRTVVSSSLYNSASGVGYFSRVAATFPPQSSQASSSPVVLSSGSQRVSQLLSAGAAFASGSAMTRPQPRTLTASAYSAAGGVVPSASVAASPPHPRFSPTSPVPYERGSPSVVSHIPGRLFTPSSAPT